MRFVAWLTCQIRGQQRSAARMHSCDGPQNRPVRMKSSESEDGSETGPVEGEVVLVDADLELLPTAPQPHPQPARPAVALP